MADELKDIKVTDEMLRRAQENAMSGIIDKDNPELTYKILKENAKEFRESFNKELKKLKFEELGKKLQNELLSDAKKAFEPKQGFLQKLGFREPTKDDLATQYRARQMAGGVESIMEGRFASGARQLASTIPQIANFMGGPYYLALQLVVSGLIKLDSALSKATKTASLMTGGINSEMLGDLGQRFSNMQFIASTRMKLHDIGMGSEYNNIVNAMIKGAGYGSYQGKQAQTIESLAYAQKGLSSLGISADTANTLMNNLSLLEGKGQTGQYAQLQRFIDRAVGSKDGNIKSTKYLSPEEYMRQSLSLLDQTKMLGMNFEWANRAVKQFEGELKRGTISLSDFAAVNRSLQGGGLSQNAGLSALITNYAYRTGIKLPESFLQSNALGQGFALSLPSMLSNRNILKAYQGQLSEMIQQIGGNNRYERAGALQAILQSRGINVSATAALEAIRPDGSVDLERAKIMGTAAFRKREEEEASAKQYQSAVEKYYTDSEGYVSKMMHWVGGIYDKVVGGAYSEEIKQVSNVLYDDKPNKGKRLIQISLQTGNPTQDVPLEV